MWWASIADHLIRKKYLTLFRQLEEALFLQALNSQEDLNCPGICWKGNTAGHKQSREFLESTGRFLTQLVEELTRGGSLLDLICANNGELLRDVKVWCSFACNDHGMVEFRITRGGNK